jgi:hypothetical protein
MPPHRFSIIVFGTALIYTIINWLPGVEHPGSLNVPLLLVSLAIALVVAFALKAVATNGS